MRTHYNSHVLAAFFFALSASADRAHEVFEVNKDTILAQPITVCGEVAFSVGRATSSRNSGDAVGYTKAAELAKWNLGEKYRTHAAWPKDIQETEKDVAWAEYRSQHPERFSVFGMQRIWTRKTPPDCYCVVLGFPADQVNVPKPTEAELQAALDKVRERRRLNEAAKVKTELEPSPSANPRSGVMRPTPIVEQEGSVKKLENLDANLVL